MSIHTHKAKACVSTVKKEPFLSLLNEDDIEIALLAHALTKEQKDALMIIIL